MEKYLKVTYKWLGINGMEITIGNQNVLIDPFISRHKNCIPEMTINIDYFKKVDYICVTHGHFDNFFDVPSIAKKHKCQVYAPSEAVSHVREEYKKGIIWHILDNVNEFWLDDIKVEVFKHDHCPIGFPNVVVAILNLIKERELIKFLSMAQKSWTKNVYSFYFKLKDRKILFIGSLGKKIYEFPIKSVNVMTLPIAKYPLKKYDLEEIEESFRVIERFSPKEVILVHWDAYYPAMSGCFPIGEYKQRVEAKFPNIKFHIPVILKKFNI